MYKINSAQKLFEDEKEILPLYGTPTNFLLQCSVYLPVNSFNKSLHLRQEILESIDDPAKLEKLYRSNKPVFKDEFNLIYPEIKDNIAAQVWHERLNNAEEPISLGTNKELLFVIIASLLAGLTAKLPDMVGIDPEFFYPRNIGFIVFPFLSAYFAWKNRLSAKRILSILLAFAVSAIYINLLPGNEDNQTLMLACIHQLLIFWAILGIAFAGNYTDNSQTRMSYLRYNGDLTVMTTIILIGGLILAGLTLTLFKLIDIGAEEFYLRYIGIFGLAAAPVVGTYLVRTNPQLISKVSPVMAKVFTPLVLITLVVYLAAVVFTGKDPYNDREFLLIFNLLLIGVMALIIFSIAESSSQSKNKAGTAVLIALSAVTIVLNAIALSAIVFRISEWGISPNKLAVLVGNLLILANLLLVTYKLIRTWNDDNAREKTAAVITSYIPVYCIWAAIVTVVFPIVFGFR